MSEKEDYEHLLSIIEAARILIGQYIEPGPRSAVDTVDRLIDVLDDREVVATLDRLRRRKVIRIVE